MSRFPACILLCLLTASTLPAAHAQSEYLRRGEHALTAAGSYAWSQDVEGAYAGSVGYALSTAQGVTFDGGLSYARLTRESISFSHSLTTLGLSGSVGYQSAEAEPFTLKATVAYEQTEPTSGSYGSASSWTFAASAAPTIRPAGSSLLVPQLGFFLVSRGEGRRLEPGASFSLGLLPGSMGRVRVLAEPGFAYANSTGVVFSGTLGLLVRVMG